MRCLKTAGLPFVVAIVLAASPLSAQDGPVRDGFWGSVGGGVGFNLTENSEGERLTGFSAFARAGYDLRLGDSLYLTLGADWLFQDVSVNTPGDNQLGMLTLGLTFF